MLSYLTCRQLVINKLSKSKKPLNQLDQGAFKVTRVGLEPTTLGLKVRCSSQLSYQVIAMLGIINLAKRVQI